MTISYVLMDAPTYQPKIRSGLSNGARRVVFAASLIVAFLLGTTMRMGDAKTADGVEPKSVVSDIAKILGHEPVREGFTTDRNLSLLWKVRASLEEKYLHGPINDDALYYGALRGMVASLGDPYTNFFDPEEAKAFEAELNGTFEGIGAEIGIRNNMITIIAPLPESPAEQAGIRAKDIVLRIDEVPTDGMTVDEAVRRIRGKGGTSVKLMVLHDKARTPVEISIVRDAIVFQSVRSSMTPEGYALVELHHFNDDTPELFRKAVSDLSKRNPKGWILDLRNNPGGLLTAAVEVLGEFVPNEVAVQERDLDGIVETLTAYGEGRLKGKKVAVLVNGGSASASEIVAGCIQDYGAGTIIGEQTFGKGVVQELEDLEGGAQLKVTVAEWLTGKGRSIDKQGVAPDIKIELKSEDVNADRDPQLDRAKEFLKNGK